MDVGDDPQPSSGTDRYRHPARPCPLVHREPGLQRDRHADHVYKHDADAMLAFWLLAMLAFNLFHAFYFRNLSPDTRKSYSRRHLAR